MGPRDGPARPPLRPPHPAFLAPPLQLKPINDAHALTVGADLVSQSFLLSTAIGLVLLEYWRSSTSAALAAQEKAAEKAVRQAAKEARLAGIEAAVLRLEADVRRLERGGSWLPSLPRRGAPAPPATPGGAIARPEDAVAVSGNAQSGPTLNGEASNADSEKTAVSAPGRAAGRRADSATAHGAAAGGHRTPKDPWALPSDPGQGRAGGAAHTRGAAQRHDVAQSRVEEAASWSRWLGSWWTPPPVPPPAPLQ